MAGALGPGGWIGGPLGLPRPTGLPIAALVLAVVCAPYAQLLVDGNENLWVSEFAKPGQNSVAWSVFDGAGSMVGRLRLPTTRTILHIASDHVLVLDKDDLGVETVALFGIVR